MLETRGADVPPCCQHHDPIACEIGKSEQIGEVVSFANLLEEKLLSLRLLCGNPEEIRIVSSRPAKRQAIVSLAGIERNGHAKVRIVFPN